MTNGKWQMNNGLALAVLLAVVMERRRLFLDDCVKVDWAPPELVDILEHLARVLEIEFRALVAVAHEKLKVAVVIAVGDLYVWVSEVGHVGHELIAHALPAFIADGPLLLIDQLVNEQVKLFA